jgi:uncharacterized membrane protein YqhA
MESERKRHEFQPGKPSSNRVNLLRSLLAGSRFFIAIAVLGSYVAAVAVIVYGGITVYDVVRDAFSHHIDAKGAKALAVEAIELIDIFLLGTVLYIVALGLYELFIDADLPMPPWLRIATLDDLKEKLIGVVIVLLGVSFLGKVATWESGHDIAYFGGAIAVVILALAAFLKFGNGGEGHPVSSATNAEDDHRSSET